MPSLARLSATLVLLTLLGVSAGCQAPSRTSGDLGVAPFADGAPTAGTGPSLAASSAVARSPDENRGGLLRTGAIMLGPGVCRNWWRWQGDGLWGF
jgi:hypothetical protein